MRAVLVALVACAAGLWVGVQLGRPFERRRMVLYAQRQMAAAGNQHKAGE